MSTSSEIQVFFRISCIPLFGRTVFKRTLKPQTDKTVQQESNADTAQRGAAIQ